MGEGSTSLPGATAWVPSRLIAARTILAPQTREAVVDFTLGHVISDDANRQFPVYKLSSNRLYCSSLRGDGGLRVYTGLSVLPCLGHPDKGVK